MSDVKNAWIRVSTEDNPNQRRTGFIIELDMGRYVHLGLIYDTKVTNRQCQRVGRNKDRERLLQ